MPRLGNHHRNHSFPSCFWSAHKSSAKLPHPPSPLNDIDERPWEHFLSPVLDETDDGFLDFTAGIITSSEASKKKASKFRPSSAKKWEDRNVSFHHGAYSRFEEDHGFVENRRDPWSHIVEHNVSLLVEPQERDVQLRPRGRSKTRNMSGHRHSWREPSAELFVLEEESENVEEDFPMAKKVAEASFEIDQAMPSKEDKLLPTERTRRARL